MSNENEKDKKQMEGNQEGGESKKSFIPENKSKKKMAKQIAESNHNMQTLQSNMQMLQQMIIGQANFMKKISEEIDRMNKILGEVVICQDLIIDSLKVDKDEFQTMLNNKKISLFEAKSKAEDEELGVENDEGGVVTDKSIITLTSTIPGSKDGGILRTKVDLSEPMNLPGFKEACVGKKINESFEFTIDKDIHKITILSISKKAEKKGE